MKKLLPIIGLLLLVSCKEQDIVDAVKNGPKADKVERKEITGRENMMSFLKNKSCKLTDIDMTDEDITDVGGSTGANIEDLSSAPSTFTVGTDGVGGQTGLTYSTLHHKMVDWGQSTLSLSMTGIGNQNVVRIDSHLEGEENRLKFRGKFKLFNDGTLEGRVLWFSLAVGPDWGGKYIGFTPDGVELDEDAPEFTVTCK